MSDKEKKKHNLALLIATLVILVSVGVGYSYVFVYSSENSNQSVNKRTTPQIDADISGFQKVVNIGRWRSNHNVTLFNKTVEDKILVVEHSVDHGATYKRAKAVGSIAEAYAIVVERGWEIKRLEGYVESEDGTVLLTYSIKRGWAAKRMNGTISKDVYFSYIHSTQDVRVPLNKTETG